MAVNGKLCIFRMTNTTDTENTITADKLEFDEGALIPDAKAGIQSFNPSMSRFQTDNPIPYQNKTNKPDTGFSGTRYQLNIFFNESDGLAGGVNILKKWYKEDNAITKKFRHGRFGIRNDYRPEFNLIPDNTAGYKLVHYDLFQDLAINHLVPGVIILEFSGDASKL